MTNEEAIKSLMNDWFMSLGGQLCVDGDKKDRFTEAIGKAVVALKHPESLRPKGEWYWLAYDANPKIGNWHCSVCNRIPKSLKKEDFCPNCGADMRGES